MDGAWPRAGARILTLVALLGFLAWIASLQPLLLLAAVASAAAAYVLFLVDRGNRIAELAGYGRDTQDRVLEGSETAVVPGVSVGGIHLSYESRTRWRTRR